MSIRLVLDITRRDTNVLFDRFTGQRMTFRKPLCVVPFISEPMRISIRNGKVVDVDNATGIEVRPEHKRNHDAVLSMLGIERAEKPTVPPVDPDPTPEGTVEGAGEVAETESEKEVKQDTDVDEAKEPKKNTRKKKEEGEK